MEAQRFGKLVVVGLHGRDSNYNKKWLCRCDCGNHHVVLGHKLKDGSVKSCGCLGKELREAAQDQAGLDRRKSARISYKAMLSRCHNPNNTKYYAYGQRGILVCDRWRFGEGGRTGFECFFLDMGPKPVDHTIDRIDNSLGYTPENCRWVTHTAQARNRENVAKVHCDGEFLPWLDVVDRLGLDQMLSRVCENAALRHIAIKKMLTSIG